MLFSEIINITFLDSQTKLIRNVITTFTPKIRIILGRHFVHYVRIIFKIIGSKMNQAE